MPPGGVLPKGDNYHYLLIQIGIVRCFRPQSFRYLSFRLLSLSIQNTANIHNMRASSSEGSRPIGRELFLLVYVVWSLGGNQESRISIG